MGASETKSNRADFISTDSYVDTTLTTWSLTPRLSMKNSIFGMNSTVLTGIDYYDAMYDSNRSEAPRDRAIHAIT